MGRISHPSHVSILNYYIYLFLIKKKKKKSGDSVDRSPKDTLKYRMKEKVLSWVIGTVPAGCIIDF